MLICVSVYANIVCPYYVHRAHDPAHVFTIIQSYADTIKTPPRRQGLGFSGGGGSEREMCPWAITKYFGDWVPTQVLKCESMPMDEQSANQE